MKSKTEGLRLMVYDRTCLGGWPFPGLTLSWQAGGWLYARLGRLDARHGATTWDDALEWLASQGAPDPIQEIQFWGHGKWGAALIDGTPLDVSALDPSHRHLEVLNRIRERLVPGQKALWWFRTCETFGGRVGQQFARAWTDFFHCRAAGHTYVIGPYQSGLHVLRPGEIPNWPLDEGFAPGTNASTVRTALWSSRSAPNTINCLQGRIPDGF